MANIKRKDYLETSLRDIHSLLPMKKRKLKPNDSVQIQYSNLNLHEQLKSPSTFQGNNRETYHQYYLQSATESKNMVETYEILCKEKNTLLKSIANEEKYLLNNKKSSETPANSVPGLKSQVLPRQLDTDSKICKKKRESTVFDLMWQQRYDELIAFWKKYGHCCVPQRYIPNQALGKWVHKQRQEFRKKRDGGTSSLTPYRIEALQKIGFQVDTKNRAEALWQQRYKELVQFRKAQGHCNVPQKFFPNKALGKWVHRQRHEFKKLRHGEPSFLTNERIEALDTIGFQISPGQHRRNGPIQVSAASELNNRLHRQDLERNVSVSLVEQFEFKRHMLIRAAHEKLVALNSTYISRTNVLDRLLDRRYYNLAAKSA